MEIANLARRVKDGLFQNLVMVMKMATGIPSYTTKTSRLAHAIQIGRVVASTVFKEHHD